MSAELDSLMRKSKALEAQINQLAVVLTKERLDQAVRGNYIPPRLYDRAIKRGRLGWNVSVNIIDARENVSDWEREQ